MRNLAMLVLLTLPQAAFADCVYTGAKRAYLECIYDTAVVALSDATAAAADLATLTLDVIGLSSRLDDAEFDLTALDSSVTGLGGDIFGLQTDVSGLQTSLGALQTDVSGLQTGLGALQTDVSGLQAAATSDDSRLDLLETDVDGLLADYLGLGDIGTTAGTVAAGDDARFGQWSGASTGLDAATGRASLGLGSAALAASGAFATAAQGTTADAALPRAGGTVTGNLQVNGSFTLGASLAAENGYTTLPNGFIMQWGVVPANASHPRRFNFPVTFPNAVYSIVSSVRENNIILSNPVLISNSQADMYVWKSSDASIDNTHGVYWFAIGR
jgi:hypothetical protein